MMAGILLSVLSYNLMMDLDYNHNVCKIIKIRFLYVKNRYTMFLIYFQSSDVTHPLLILFEFLFGRL